MKTVEEKKAEGREYRKVVPRSALGQWDVETNRELVKALLTQQESRRMPLLVPLRHQRMAVSPFTFFRGSAILQAHDLAMTPYTDLRVQGCGDAHISNFGIFASPERRMVFDINDFDETLPIPFDCDIKRLAASVEICGRDRGFSLQDRTEAVYQTANMYRESMNKFSETGTLNVWYDHIDIENATAEYGHVADEEHMKIIQKITKKATQKNSYRAIKKYTEVVDGKLRIKSDPPILTPLRDLVGEEKASFGFSHNIADTLEIYKQSLPEERRRILNEYVPVEMAHKVVGVGSVGTQAWILVLMGRNPDDPLVLQIKEANESVLEPWFGASNYTAMGQRVVEGQRAIQTAGDILLGWLTLKTQNGYTKSYYVRQFWDAKGSFDLEKIDPAGLTALGSMCAWTLAHAHAKTGRRHIISGYLGNGDVFENAMVRYASAYADQVEADYELFLKMI